MKTKKGSVLLIVLILLTASLALSVYLSEKNTESYAKVVNIKNTLQANIVAATAASSVAEILKDDNNKSDSQDDIWATPFSYNQDNIFINVSVTPLNGKININNLYNSTSDVSKRIISSFEKIVADYNINLASLHKLADYIDNNTENMPFGMENEQIEYYGRKLNIKNKPLETFYESSLIVDNGSYNVLKNIFTSDTGETKININFASKDVLNYYIPELTPYVEDIIKYRESKVFNDISEIRKASNIPNDIYQAIIQYITVKSDNYYLRINIEISDNLFYYHSLINKKEGILIFFKGLNENYF